MRSSAAFFLASVLLMSLGAFQSASASPPAGYFYFQSDLQDGSHAFGVMDVQDSAGMVTGLVQLNQPAMKGSQYWKELRPAQGNGDTFRIQNMVTGQCLADASGDSANVTIRPCNDESTLWQKILEVPGKIRFRRTTHVTWPYPDIQICPGKDLSDPGHVFTLTCYDDSLVGGVFWSETTEPLGTVSTPSAVDLPPEPPPERPANCKIPGGTAQCGLVEFSCDPFSASYKMVVASGLFGVKVTDVQPNIGLIIGSYLNSGKASVAVCATKSGQSACGDPIEVAFGNTVCTGGGGLAFTCPKGQIHCGTGCTPPSPECFPK